jgi:hypothetical protein
MSVFFTSCEEVIDVDLDSAEPRLVIDAALKWEKNSQGNFQSIFLTTTTDYFTEDVPPVSGAVVTVTDSQNNVFSFIEVESTGQYDCINFIPVLNETYTLTVVTGGQTYTATETLRPVPQIDYLVQNAEGGFTGDEREVEIYFTDNAATTDFYLFTYISPAERSPVYEVLEDRLIQGNQTFTSYSDDELESGDEVTLAIAGISERYFNYLRILLSISGGGSGSPFQAPPVTVRGNIVNSTNSQNYALGYFSLSETDVKNVVIE